jgi:acyl-CoA thioesterase
MDRSPGMSRPLPPEPPSNIYRPLVDLLRVDRIGNNVFRSTAPPFTNRNNGRAYGGHVYAQAAWAAAQTVEKGFVIHVS